MRIGRLSKKKCYPFLNYILLRYAAKKKETINVIYCARVFMKRVHTVQHISSACAAVVAAQR